MAKPTKFVRELRDLAFVPRWGIIRQIKQQSVAEHTFFVAVYAKQVLAILGSMPASAELWREVMEYALDHDWAESYTSDLPGPAKRGFADMARLEAYEAKHNSLRFGPTSKPKALTKAIVKVADYLDEVLYLNGELQMGNQAIKMVIPGSTARLDGAIDNLEAAMVAHPASSGVQTPEEATARCLPLRQEIALAITHEGYGHSSMDFDP